MALAKQRQDLCGSNISYPKHEVMLAEELFGLIQNSDRPAYVSLSKPQAGKKHPVRWRRQVEAKSWANDRLKVMILQAVVLQAHGDMEKAVQLLLDALALAEPGGFVRSFVDEGVPMAHLVSAAAAHGRMSDYIGKLLAVFEAGEQMIEGQSSRHPTQPLIEPLSHRELEVLRLIGQGLSNQEIGERLGQTGLGDSPSRWKKTATRC